MNAIELKFLIKQEKLVPILRIPEAEPVMAITEAVVAANARIIEFTTTIPGVFGLITKVKEWAPNATLVGFKLLVGATSKDFDAAVQKQMDAAGSDFVVANDLHSIRNGVHRIYIYKRNDNHPTPLEFGWGGMNLSQCVVRIVTGKWKPGKIWRQIRGDESLELALGKDGGNS